jgi:hypothetical protein
MKSAFAPGCVYAVADGRGREMTGEPIRDERQQAESKHVAIAWSARGLCTWLVLAGFGLVWTALVAIWNFGWRQPMFDRFRLYRQYLVWCSATK